MTSIIYISIELVPQCFFKIWINNPFFLRAMIAENLVYTLGVTSMLLIAWQAIYFYSHERIKKIGENGRDNSSFINELVLARESERIKIAQDLHDELGPTLTGLKLLLNSLSDSHNTEVFAQKLNLFSDKLNATIQYVRGISRNLQGEFNLQSGFVKSIRDHISLVNNNSTMEIEPWFDFDESTVKELVLENLYRIISEVITNSIHHSNDDKITLAIKKYESALFVLYIDNGSTWLKNRVDLNGTGLENIVQRVSAMNGELDIDRCYANCFIMTIKLKNEDYLRTHEKQHSSPYSNFSVNCG